ncbi:MAG: DUF4118 domain-containing protein [Pyrinomonadaceae bacterium]
MYKTGSASDEFAASTNLRIFNKPLITSLRKLSYSKRVTSSLWSKSARYVAAALAVGGATILLIFVRGKINPTTVALAFLLMILFVAMIWGSKPALLAAVLGMLSFNFFFLPPYHTFTIADPQNWIALIAFRGRTGCWPALGSRKRQAKESRSVDLYFQYLQNRSAKIYMRAAHAVPDLRVAGGRCVRSDEVLLGSLMVLEVVGAFIGSCRGRNFGSLSSLSTVRQSGVCQGLDL